MARRETDHDRLYRYAERFFQKKQRTEFPTVRRCARSLKWSKARVLEATEGDPKERLMTTGHNVVDADDWDLYVETFETK